MKKRFFLFIVLFVLMYSWAVGESIPSVMSSSIYKTEWQWQPGGSATFEGNLICRNTSEDHPLVMRLRAETIPADPGMIKPPVFTSVNDQKLTVRKQKEEYPVSSSAQAIRFTGRWELPEDLRIDEAVIHLEIYNESGEMLSESALRMKNEQVSAGNTGYRFPNISQWIWIVFAAAALIWLLALIRIFRNRQRR